MICTPIQQESFSGHGTVGGAAAAVLKVFNIGNAIDITVPYVVMQALKMVLMRYITNISAAGREIGTSRVYGGVTCDSFIYAGYPADGHSLRTFISRSRRMLALRLACRLDGVLWLWSGHFKQRRMNV